MTTKQKSSFPLLLMGAVLTTGLASCSSSSDDVTAAGGTAQLSINLNADSGFGVASRALSESSWKTVANYTVDIVNLNGEVVANYPASAIPSSITVPYGTYTVRAYYGEEKDASRNTFLSEGSEVVNLGSGEEKAVSINCAPTCGKVKVAFADDMGEYFDDYYVTFSTPKMAAGSVATWAKDDAEPWYLAVAPVGDLVTATIHLTPNEKYETNKTLTEGLASDGTIVRTYTLNRNKAWTLGIAPNYTTSIGTLGISITIDDTTNDHEVEIVIPSEWI